MDDLLKSYQNHLEETDIQLQLPFSDKEKKHNEYVLDMKYMLGQTLRLETKGLIQDILYSKPYPGYINYDDPGLKIEVLDEKRNASTFSAVKISSDRGVYKLRQQMKGTFRKYKPFFYTEFQDNFPTCIDTNANFVLFDRRGDCISFEESDLSNKYEEIGILCNSIESCYTENMNFMDTNTIEDMIHRIIFLKKSNMLFRRNIISKISEYFDQKFKQYIGKSRTGFTLNDISEENLGVSNKGKIVVLDDGVLYPTYKGKGMIRYMMNKKNDVYLSGKSNTHNAIRMLTAYNHVANQSIDKGYMKFLLTISIFEKLYLIGKDYEHDVDKNNPIMRHTGKYIVENMKFDKSWDYYNDYESYYRDILENLVDDNLDLLPQEYSRLFDIL